MNILGEGFHPNIIGQIDARQKVFASGYNPNNPRTPEFIAYAASNTSYLKMMSSVSLNDLEALNNPTIKTLGLKGTELAKQAILFGGVKALDGNLKGGILNTTPSIFNDFAYGFGGTEYGLRPMPGLLSATIKSENIGSLKTATINIKAWSRTQFEIIDVLYLRLGFYVLLEWGHVNYVNNNGELQTNGIRSLESKFFSNDASVDGIQNDIINNRYNSYGNYDAILGRVVNFSWTFEDDGSYNITVIVRSIGDIIESLKMNILTKPINVPNAPFLTQDKIQQQNIQQQNRSFSPIPSSVTSTISNLYPEKNNISIKLNEYKQSLESSKFAANTSKLSNNELNDLYKVIWNGSPNSYYIRFGAFLKLLEDEIIPSIYKGSKATKQLKFDYDIKSNLVNYIDIQISTDPRKILIEREFNIENQTYKILPGAEDFVTKISNEAYGNLMNVYINFDYIISLLDELTDVATNKAVLIDFLKKLCATISQCLGSINNITPIIDDDTNTVKFIDQNTLYNKRNVITYLRNQNYNINDQPGIFDLYGYQPGKYNQSGSAGFIKEFTMKTELTSQFADMITIGAAAKSKVVGEDATALSKLNSGLTSSLFESLADPGLDINKSLSLEEQYSQAISDYYTFIKSMNMLGIRPTWNDTSFNTFPSVLNSLVKYTEQSTYEKTKIPSTSTGFIPLNVSLTMTGMSGMKIYQEFTLDTNYLPSNYDRTMTWLIKGITHTINNNTWTTIIESLSLPKIVTKPLLSDFRVAEIINPNIEYEVLSTSGFNQNNIRTAVQFLLKQEFRLVSNSLVSIKRLSDAQIAGIIGNLLFESSLDPRATNGNTIGIAQWLGSRKQQLLSKSNWSNLTTQLNFIIEEFNSTEKAARNLLLKTKDVKEAAIIFDSKYERSEQTNYKQRVGYALDIYNKLPQYK